MKPHSLISVDNGSGKIINFHYTPVTNEDIVKRTSGRDSELPHKFWVVEEVVIEDYSRIWKSYYSKTSYRYSDPIYGSESGRLEDPRQFLGFTTITKTLPLGGQVMKQYTYDLEGDGRGFLVAEETSIPNSNGAIPITRKEITWDTKHLFDREVTFTYQTSFPEPIPQVQRMTPIMAKIYCEPQTPGYRGQI